MSSVSIAGNTSGSVTLSAPDVAGNTTLTLPTTSGTVALTASPTFTGTVTTPSLTFSDGSTQTAAASPFGLKNRIINGDMVISQRNGTNAVTTPDVYTVDRWQQFAGGGGVISWQQSSIAPTGFENSLSATVTTPDTSLGTSDYYFLRQFIEGFNVADLAWGTANARTVTLSFWVRSSLTGTFGGCLQNGGTNRFYPFTYTISAANTWEQKSVTIPGDITGTWLKTNGAGLGVTFSLGFGTNFIGTANAWTSSSFWTATGSTNVVSTNGATWYITGVQLERNTTATPFEWLPYTTELQLCQRYYEKSFPINVAPVDNLNVTNTSTTQVALTSYLTNNYISQFITYQVNKRAAPTVTFYQNYSFANANGTAGQWKVYIGSWQNTASITCNSFAVQGFLVAGTFSSGGTTGFGYFGAGEWSSSAEL